MRSCWIKFYQERTPREGTQNRSLVDDYKKMFESGFSAGAIEKLLDLAHQFFWFASIDENGLESF